MSFVSDGVASRRPRAAPQKHSLDAALLDAVLTQIALPQAGATTGRRHPRRRRIVEAIAAYHPTDRMQAALVAQIVGARLLMQDTGRRAAARDMTAEQLEALRCTMDALARSVEGAERMLRRVQLRVGPRGDATARRLDLLAENPVGRSYTMHRESGRCRLGVDGRQTTRTSERGQMPGRDRGR